MISQRQNLKQKTSQTIRQKQIGRIKLAQLFSLPEDEFRKLITEIEKDSFFQELVHKWRVINYKKFSGVRIPFSLSLNEQIVSSSENFDLESLLYQDSKAIPILKKIGAIIGKDRFRELLYKGMDVSEITEKCKLTREEKEALKIFLDKFELGKIVSGTQDFFPDESIKRSDTRVFKIATIEREEDRLVIYPYSGEKGENYLAKGNYYINHNQFEQLYKKRKFTQGKIRQIFKTFRMLDLVNRRSSTIYRIIQHIKERQSDYLYSGNIDDLKPLTRRELANKIGVHPSSITRVMVNKSILTPQDKEKSLEFFFPSQKEINEGYVKNLIEEERILLQNGTLPYPYNDETIRSRLYQDYLILVSRRAVTKYRKELRIPSSNKRLKELKEETRRGKILR